MDRVCSATDCEDPVHASGKCQKHYNEQRRADQKAIHPAIKRDKSQSPEIQSLTKKLEEAKHLYSISVGPARIKWWGKVNELSIMLGKLRKPVQEMVDASN